MSGSIYGQLTGSLEWGALRVGDLDTRSKDFGPDLSQPGTRDTITSVASVTITRLDNVTMGANDLALKATPTVDTAKRVVGLWLGQGVAGVAYNVEICVTTVGGRTICRDTPISVVGELG
jgi:hypothetical protein